MFSPARSFLSCSCFFANVLTLFAASQNSFELVEIMRASCSTHLIHVRTLEFQRWKDFNPNNKKGPNSIINLCCACVTRCVSSRRYSNPNSAWKSKANTTFSTQISPVAPKPAALCAQDLREGKTAADVLMLLEVVVHRLPRRETSFQLHF